jgi:hypothetical protein
MIRRFNYTNRLRIRRKDVQIRVRDEGGKLAFDADLSALAGYELPAESLVFVEAYRQAVWMRFGFGQVGAITPAKNRILAQFDSPDGIKFRVKVTPHGDTHTLLAEADAIPLATPEQKEGERTPLLPVKPQKIGDEIYRLDFSGQDGRPLLLINSDAGNYADIGRAPAFVSLVYPAVLREILVRTLIVEKHDDDSDSQDWRSQWIRFASLHSGLGELPGPEEVDERCQWIEKAVTAFSRKLQVRTKFSEYWREGK